ncbi:PspA/IM30 family protein [Kordiimonas gwangyangensis]|uniref:PspA/IM30 family protein n=1 Tax=Kordiimonas gwangyangensis TaxID=288022 RepID=UPI000687D7D5|nr:PspA/IM30 family protein [Kordiimonas gwangyangensis]
MSNIASRVSRLIAGSVNAALDAVENMSPEMVMEQAIREVEGAIAEVRAEMGKATAERHLASKKLADNSGKHEELLEQIEVAVSKGRDDLASAAISRQMDLEARCPCWNRLSLTRPSVRRSWKAMLMPSRANAQRCWKN